MLWDVLAEADKFRYIATCSIDSNVRSKEETIGEFGLCNYHSYTMLQCLAVKLHKDGKTVRYLMQLRNPWGQKEWTGPWCDNSETWKKYPYAHEQLRVRDERQQASQNSLQSTGTLGVADDGRFWILYKDFFNFFFRVTINYSNDRYSLVRIADQIPDEEWGVSRLNIPQDHDGPAFISIF